MPAAPGNRCTVSAARSRSTSSAGVECALRYSDTTSAEAPALMTVSITSSNPRERPLSPVEEVAEEADDHLELGVAAAGQHGLEVFGVAAVVLADAREVRGDEGDDHLAAIVRVAVAADVAALLEPVEHAGDGARGQSR